MVEAGRRLKREQAFQIPVQGGVVVGGCRRQIQIGVVGEMNRGHGATSR